MTTHPSITRLRELSEKATAPPWRERYIRFSIADSNLADDNDNFIAESRNALPVLLDCLEMALSSLDGIAKDDEDHSEYRKCCEFQDKADITVKAITAKLNTLKGGSDVS